MFRFVQVQKVVTGPWDISEIVIRLAGDPPEPGPPAATPGGNKRKHLTSLEVFFFHQNVNMLCWDGFVGPLIIIFVAIIQAYFNILLYILSGTSLVTVGTKTRLASKLVRLRYFGSHFFLIFRVFSI